MKIRYLKSMCMVLALVFSSAIAMIPDNQDNNKRKRDDNCLEETFNPDDYAGFFEWLESDEKQENSNISSSSEQQSKNVHDVDTHKKRKIIEKVPENSSQDNQNFNINTTQNNLQENGLTVSVPVSEFNKQINNHLIPQSSSQGNQNIVVNNTQQASDVGKGIFYNFKLDGNKCPYCQKDFDSTSFLKKHVGQCSKNPSAVKIRGKTYVNDPYIIKNLDGSYYCSLCKKYVFYFKKHGDEKEHRINMYAGKNVLKKKLEKPLECQFPSCKEVFDDIDALIDHMIDTHRNKNKQGCFFPECPHNGKYLHRLRSHLLCNHTEKDKKFFMCPCCEVFTARRLDTIWNNHISSCNGPNVQFKEIIINNYNKNSSSVPVQCAHQRQITHDPIPKSIKDCDYTGFVKWYESESKQEEEEITEKIPENSSQDNQNFNINNVQNNFQENGPTVSMDEFRTQINNDVIPKPIIPKHIKEFDCEKFLMWEKSNKSNLQDNQKINNNVVNNIVINGPVSVSIQQQPSFSLEQIMEISQLLQQQQQQSQQVVSQQNIDIPSNDQGPSNVLISDQEDKEIKNIKAPYITTRDGFPYCLVCKKRVLKPGIHKTCNEHLINASAGKNILKKELQASLKCDFPGCNKVFNDIDDFLDHMFDEHVDDNRMCTYPECIKKKGAQRVKREHFSAHHVNSKSKKFFRCPFCEDCEASTMDSLRNSHWLSAKKCSECLKQILTKKSKK